jgi:hypothetical protein
MLLIALCVEVTFAHAQELRSIESINQSCSPASRELELSGISLVSL